MIFYSSLHLLHATDSTILFLRSLLNYDEFSIFATDKCTPLVREITFENAEEFTEEGLPFLILFYEPGDNDNIKKYSDVIQRELLDEKREFQFDLRK